MKHKNFDKIFPYTYFVRHKETGIKYYGVRWGNVKTFTAPEKDLGHHYFTSIKNDKFSWFKKEFKTHPEHFEYRVHYTFDMKEEAIEFERRLTRKIFRRPDWANMNSGRAIDLSWKSEEDQLIRRAKLSRSLQGKNTGKRPKWVCDKMKQNHSDFSGSNHPRYGKTISDETRLRLRNSALQYYKDHPEKKPSGSKNPMYTKGRSFIAISPNGEKFFIEGGFTIFCKDREITYSLAVRCAKGLQPATKGWKFHFNNELTSNDVN